MDIKNNVIVLSNNVNNSALDPITDNSDLNEAHDLNRNDFSTNLNKETPDLTIDTSQKPSPVQVKDNFLAKAFRASVAKKQVSFVF